MVWIAEFNKDSDKMAGSLTAHWQDKDSLGNPVTTFTYGERVESDDLRLDKFAQSAKDAKIVDDQKKQEEQAIKDKVESILNA